MVFRIKPILSQHQLRRSKFTIGLALLAVCLLCFVDNIHSESVMYTEDDMNRIQEMDPNLDFDVKDYKSWSKQEFERGQIVYFSSDDQVCNSSFLIPGTALLPKGFLVIFYFFTLIYIFLGMHISADIFMESIESITAQKQTLRIVNDQGDVIKSKEISLWNPTVANLTLMALGSSAPEFLLCIIESVAHLGHCPGELGSSAIVGAGAYNLLVIMAVCVYAVNEDNDNSQDRDTTVVKGVKKINDLGVFMVTSSTSIFAYIWVWFVLRDQMVNMVEAVFTFLFFFVLIALAFIMDRVKALREGNSQETEKVVELKQQITVKHSAVEIYRELMEEKFGVKAKNIEQQTKRTEMKKFLKTSMQTDMIDKVNLDELKNAIMGVSIIKSRVKQREDLTKIMHYGLRPIIMKNQISKQEHIQAVNIDKKFKNSKYGFKCLNYSVSQASEVLRIHIFNKAERSGMVRVVTFDGKANAGLDYQMIKKDLSFTVGQERGFIDVKIMNDDNWKQDHEFYVQLVDPITGTNLVGKDTKTKVMILDDNDPGRICFKDNKMLRVHPNDGYAKVHLIRKDGKDGQVTVDWKTVQLGESSHTASPGVDYVESQGQVIFENGDIEKVIKVQILPKISGNRRLQETDESFGIKLENIQPEGASLTNQNFQVINIVSNIKKKMREEAMKQLMKKMEQKEEHHSWGNQFIQACMLHPTKDEDGEVEEISTLDATLHFITIGWKVLFAFIPPPHYCGGYATFFISLAFIGFLSFFVGQFAGLFGCVLNLKPQITAITFVALGTGLPDTFASGTAATQAKYADQAIVNVTGSNSVNVFLGLGVPWVIAVIYEQTTSTESKGYETMEFFVPSANLAFSVAIFCLCAFICFCTLMIRRRIVGGELGGTRKQRCITSGFFIFLWFIFLSLSILQAYGMYGLDKITMGIDRSVRNPNDKCN